MRWAQARSLRVFSGIRARKRQDDLAVMLPVAGVKTWLGRVVDLRDERPAGWNYAEVS